MMDVGKFLFEVNSVSTEKGCVHTSSPTINTKLCTVVPPPFGLDMTGKWSAEHLFLASAGNCYLHTFMVLADIMALPFENISCNVMGVIEKHKDILTFQNIDIETILIINNTKLHEKALKVLADAERCCIIKNAIKTPINIKNHIEVHVQFKKNEAVPCY